MAENLVLETDDRGDMTVVSVKGEVDLYTAPSLKDRVADLVSAGRNRLAVDLGGVEFMDSTGLGVLIGGLKRCKEAGGSLALIAPREPVIKVLAITGLDKVFSIHESVDQAASS
ncbi:MAG: STAS domain-containing protein [Actinomycetota bacterium]